MGLPLGDDELQNKLCWSHCFSQVLKFLLPVEHNHIDLAYIKRYVLMYTYIHIKRYKLMQTDIFLGKAVWQKRDDVKTLQEEGYGVFSKRNWKPSTTSSQICEGFPSPFLSLILKRSTPANKWAHEPEKDGRVTLLAGGVKEGKHSGPAFNSTLFPPFLRTNLQGLPLWPTC